MEMIKFALEATEEELSSGVPILTFPKAATSALRNFTMLDFEAFEDSKLQVNDSSVDNKASDTHKVLIVLIKQLDLRTTRMSNAIGVPSKGKVPFTVHAKLEGVNERIDVLDEILKENFLYSDLI